MPPGRAKSAGSASCKRTKTTKRSSDILLASASDLFFASSDLVQHVFSFLDDTTITGCAAVSREWLSYAAHRLYREIDGLRPRGKIYAGSVRSITITPPFITARIRKKARKVADLLPDECKIPDGNEIDRYRYHPALVTTLIAELHRLCPRLNRINVDAATKSRTGSTWSVSFNDDGDSGDIWVADKVETRERIEYKHRLFAPPGFRVLPSIALVGAFGSAEPPTLAEDIRNLAYNVESIKFCAHSRTQLVNVLRGLVDGVKAARGGLESLQLLEAGVYYGWAAALYESLSELDSLLDTFQLASNLKQLRLATESCRRVDTGISLYDVDRILDRLSRDHTKLKELTLDLDWDRRAEEQCSAWPCHRTMHLDKLVIRLDTSPTVPLYNLSAYLSRHMAPYGTLHFMWLGRDADFAHLLTPESHTGAMKVADYSPIGLNLKRLSERYDGRPFPYGASLEALGIREPNDIDHLMYNSDGSLKNVYDSLVSRTLDSCRVMKTKDLADDTTRPIIERLLAISHSERLDDLTKRNKRYRYLKSLIPTPDASDTSEGDGPEFGAVKGLSPLLGYIKDRADSLDKQFPFPVDLDDVEGEKDMDDGVVLNENEAESKPPKSWSWLRSTVKPDQQSTAVGKSPTKTRPKRTTVSTKKRYTDPDETEDSGLDGSHDNDPPSAARRRTSTAPAIQPATSVSRTSRSRSSHPAKTTAPTSQAAQPHIYIFSSDIESDDDIVEMILTPPRPMPTTIGRGGFVIDVSDPADRNDGEQEDESSQAGGEKEAKESETRDEQVALVALTKTRKRRTPIPASSDDDCYRPRRHGKRDPDTDSDSGSDTAPECGNTIKYNGYKSDDGFVVSGSDDDEDGTWVPRSRRKRARR